MTGLQDPQDNGKSGIHIHYPNNKKPTYEISKEHLSEVTSHLETLPQFQTLEDESSAHHIIYQSMVDKYASNNQNFKTNPRLADPRTRNNLLELMKDVYGRKSILFALDVEAWELDTNIVTEIGIAIYDPRGQADSLIPATIQLHIRIKEHLARTNGKYVPHHAHNFNGNTSYIMSEREAATLTQSLINFYFISAESKGTGCYLVGHDLKGDVKWMNSLGVTFPSQFKSLDTNYLFRISHGKENISLKRALAFVHIPFAYLHNAGNDAYYTLLLAMKLCDPHSRVRYRLDVLINVETYPTLTKEEKKERKNRRRQEKLEAIARGEHVEQKPPAPKQTTKKSNRKKLTCESIELESAIEVFDAMFK
ncbi:hypothetical protein MG7_04982 [Candida albicans P34048]|nr:hypothetical protein MG7_04982 [Candida albicans P34048]KHC49744.1 hypothetical protein MGC_04964 [Candida albicans P37039]